MGNFSKGLSFGVGKGCGQMPERNSRAEAQSLNPKPGLEQRLLKLGNGESPDRQYRRQLQQFAAGDLLELPRIDPCFHFE